MPQAASDQTYSTNGGERKKDNWKLYLAMMAFIVGILSIAGFGGYTVVRGQQINKKLCQFSDDNRAAIRNILIEVERQNLEEANSIREVEAITESTSKLLAFVPPVRCTVGGTPVEIERGIPGSRP